MITALIDRIIGLKLVVGLLLAAAAVLSAYSLRTASLDAIPDISDPQIIIYAKWPRSPELLEAQVTEPIVKALVGSPEIRSIRATSHMGYSFIYVILRSASQRAVVRQLVTDRLGSILRRYPTIFIAGIRSKTRNNPGRETP